MKKKLIIIGLLMLTFKTEAQTPVLKITDSILRTGDYQSALVLLEKVEKPSFEILEKMASIYEETGNYSKTIEFYQKAFVLRPSERIKEQLGKNYQYIGNSNKAVELQREVLEANPNNTLLKYNLAKLYIAERNVHKGIKLLKELTERDPKNPNFHYQLGQAYEKIDIDPTKAYLKAYELDALHLKSIYNLAKFYKLIKLKDSTGLFVDKGLKINPESLNFLQLKVQNEFLKKEYDTALVYLKKLEKQNFNTIFVHKLFGLSYYNIKDYENALTYFNKAKQKDFRDVSVLYNLGLVHKAMQDYKMAEINFLMSIMFQKLKVDKNYYNLGLVQLEQDKLKMAIKSFEEAYKNNSNDYIILLRLAMTCDDYYKDKKIALKYFEKYLDKFSEKNEESTLYVNSRVKDIKKELFVKGEKID